MSTVDGNATDRDVRVPAQLGEVLAWSVAVLVAGVVVPGGALLVAGVLFFTRLRANRTARVVLLAFGALLTLVSLDYLLSWGWESSWVSDPVVVEQE